MSHLDFPQDKLAARAAKSVITDLELAAQYLEVVPKAMREIRAELRSHRSSEMSVPHFRVMANIRRGPKTNKELAEHIGVNVATMSRMIQHLVDKKLVEKSLGQKDRREIRVQLSPAGQIMFEKIRSQARKRLALRMQVLNASEKRDLNLGLKILEKILSLDVSNVVV